MNFNSSYSDLCTEEKFSLVVDIIEFLQGDLKYNAVNLLRIKVHIKKYTFKHRTAKQRFNKYFLHGRLTPQFFTKNDRSVRWTLKW